MKTRFITGIVGIILLIGVVFSDIFGVVIFLLSILAMREYLFCFKKTQHNPIKSVAYFSTLGLLLLGLKIHIESFVLPLILYGLIIVLSILAVLKSDKYKISDVALTIFGILYIPFLFSFIIMTRNLQNGLYYIWVIFICSCVTDIFAYLVGCSIGKHKLLPSVSPKKTIEGAVGGIMGTLFVILIYGCCLNKYVPAVNVSLVHFAILGLITSVLAQLGDLFASSIKRYVGIKDYGNVLPGHGGILDRLDSIIFIAPIVYCYFRFLGGI